MKVDTSQRAKNAAMQVCEGSKRVDQTSLLGEHSEREPPDPIPNSEVKPLCADDSVAGCHVKVGHRQALKLKNPILGLGFFCLLVLWK